MRFVFCELGAGALGIFVDLRFVFCELGAGAGALGIFVDLSFLSLGLYGLYALK